MCLSPSRSLPRASLHEDEVAKRARPSLRDHHIPSVGLCWARSSHKASPDSKRGEEQKCQTAKVGGAPCRGSWGNMNITTYPREERDIIRPCIYTFSVGPLNWKAFKKLKILLTFVTPIVTPIVLSGEYLINSCGLIKLSQMHMIINLGIGVYGRRMPKGPVNKELKVFLAYKTRQDDRIRTWLFHKEYVPWNSPVTNLQTDYCSPSIFQPSL